MPLATHKQAGFLGETFIAIRFALVAVFVPKTLSVRASTCAGGTLISPQRSARTSDLMSITPVFTERGVLQRERHCGMQRLHAARDKHSQAVSYPTLAAARGLAGNNGHYAVQAHVNSPGLFEDSMDASDGTTVAMEVGSDASMDLCTYKLGTASDGHRRPQVGLKGLPVQARSPANYSVIYSLDSTAQSI